MRWIQKHAPRGGGGGAHEAAYLRFLQGDCETTLEIARREPDADDGPGNDGISEPYKGLYEGAAAACLAAFDGRADLWPVAVGRAGTIAESDLPCWDREVYAILRAFVDAHQADPAAVFSRSAAEVGDSECPTLDGLSPDHGSRAGGYVVEVRGRNLPHEPMELSLLGTYGPVWTSVDSAGRHTFVVPPADDDSSAMLGLKIGEAPRIEGVYAWLRYDS